MCEDLKVICDDDLDISDKLTEFKASTEQLDGIKPKSFEKNIYDKMYHYMVNKNNPSPSPDDMPSISIVSDKLKELESAITHIKVTLDSLSYSFYKNMSMLQRMVYMTRQQIDTQYPHVKDIEEEKKEEPILLSKGKFKIECGACGKESLSTGFIYFNGDLKYREYKCDCCHTIENEVIKEEGDA